MTDSDCRFSTGILCSWPYLLTLFVPSSHVRLRQYVLWLLVHEQEVYDVSDVCDSHLASVFSQAHWLSEIHQVSEWDKMWTSIFRFGAQSPHCFSMNMFKVAQMLPLCYWLLYFDYCSHKFEWLHCSVNYVYMFSALGVIAIVYCVLLVTVKYFTKTADSVPVRTRYV